MKKAFPWLKSSAEPVQEGRVIITGKKVVLREKCAADIEADYAWRTDEELARLDATRPITMSYAAFLRYSKEELRYSSDTSKRLAIDTHDANYIGNCMYYDISEARGEAEVGIVIGDRNYWDSGYGTDSVDTLLTHIFTTTTLQRVYLHTLDWNRRAQQAFAKSGFQEIKKVHRDGRSFLLMETFRPDWQTRFIGTGQSASETVDIESDPPAHGTRLA